MKENRILVCTQPGQLAYITQTLGELKEDHTLLKIRRVGICGTDLHAYGGTQPYFNYPRVLGHELAAEVVQSSNPQSYRPGDAVTIMPYVFCGDCLACRSGKTNCCVKMQVFGVHRDGGMAQYLQVPTRLVVKGEGLTLDELALVEPLAIGAHGVRRAAVEGGEFVLVIGAGPIGLGTMEFARIAGANVIALDINEQRLNFCKEKLKVAYTVNASGPDVTEQLKQITNGDMPTVVIDATGNLKAINNAFQYMAHGARYVLIGLQKGEICFSHPEFHKREATLMSSRNATREDFEHVISCMKKGVVDPTIYITHRVIFDDVIKEFENWMNPANGTIKAMVEMA